MTQDLNNKKVDNGPGAKAKNPGNGQASPNSSPAAQPRFSSSSPATSNNQGGHDPYNDARQKTGEVIDQVQEKAGDVVDQVQEKAGEVVDQVREQVVSQISSQKSQVAEGLGGVAQMVRMASDQLRNNKQDGVAQYVDRAANSLEDFSTFVRERELGEMVHELENFARREPVLFLGGAFTLGLLATRFLKSSGPGLGQSNQNTLARRPDDGSHVATTAPLTPQPYGRTNPNQNQKRSSAGFEATMAHNPGSSLERHFGEANPPKQEMAFRDLDNLSEIDGL